MGVLRVGFYKSLVSFVKRCPRKSLGKATEVDAVLNSCPLTCLYSDIKDNPPLTSVHMHFICGHRLTSLPYLVKEKEEIDPMFILSSCDAPPTDKG